MMGLTVQNYLSAATGIAVSLALIRGLIRKESKTLGSFWVDVTRATVYVLLPLALISALIFLWQGVPQNFRPYVTAETIEGSKQIIAQGPVASQEAIKLLGTNGGGFFNANSCHPYENPTPATNLFSLWLLVVMSAALTHTFGRLVSNTRQGWALFSAMMVTIILAAGIATYEEWQGNPAMSRTFGKSISQESHYYQVGGNMEGKEVRFGIASQACSPPLPPPLPAGPSTICTTV